MGTLLQDLSSEPIGADEPKLDLYTIPSHSGWFLWDEIHETEKLALKEFFSGNSISRTPKVYKEYRDFVINKYREEPSRRLTFTEVRKCLVGDVNLLYKVFIFLEKWGLINFGAPSCADKIVVTEDGENSRVRIEEGVPNGVRVGAAPNSVKPISAPPSAGDSPVVVDSGLKLPLLASYSDVFANLVRQKSLICGNCDKPCDSGYYKYSKADFVICVKCFENGNYGEQRSATDFELHNCADKNGNGAVWTEDETLLLLESVLKHGDDWELVAQNVQTKSTLDCILKVIELPFGEFVLSSAYRNGSSLVPAGNINSTEQNELLKCQETVEIETENQRHEPINEKGDSVEQSPSKRQRVNSVPNSGSSLMKQVALISTMVGPQVMAAAADAAVTALCDENSCSKEIFDGQDPALPIGFQSPTTNYESERDLQIEDSAMKEMPTFSGSEETCLNKDGIPLILRIRAAIATALGAAAAHAKLLSDQEEREIEHLVAIIIETQMKKLQCKLKHFEELEVIMEEEYVEMEEEEASLLEERINVLQTSVSHGISRLRDYSSVRS